MKITTDVTKSYESGTEALEDKGYKVVGTIFMNRNLREVKRILLEKNDKEYYYVGMDHYNTTVYSCTIYPVDSLKGEYRTERGL